LLIPVRQQQFFFKDFAQTCDENPAAANDRILHKGDISDTTEISSMACFLLTFSDH
jgi:hypothetical protein